MHWGRVPLTVFARVFNVFDQRFFNGSVFADDREPVLLAVLRPTSRIIDDPTRYFAPRRIEVGLTLASPSHGEKP